MRYDLIAAAVLVTACASAGPPPGGPEDRLPPRVLRVTPDTNALEVRNRVATFYFDEVVNDRGTGPLDLSRFFLVSPSDGEPRVSWHRSRIDVRPRRGFRPNTAYTVTLLPGITDLRTNAMKEGRTLIFSTGATIPTAFVRGIAFDWVGERPAPRAFIEAMTPDSVTYLAQADSLGRFTVGPLSPGSYLVRAIVDQNQNRGLDRNESWDSVRVTVPQVGDTLHLLAAPRDTLDARLLSLAIDDSLTVRATFDRLLDPTQTFAAASFRILGADSVSVPVTAVLTPRLESDRQKARAQAELDSARRADSLAGRPRPPAPATPTPQAPARASAPRIPAPFTTLALVVARPLAPNANYRVSATGVRALNGRVQSSERTFTTPRPAPPDTMARRAAPTTPAAPVAPVPGAPAPTVPPPGRR